MAELFLRITDGQFFLRPGHGHIEHPPFLFQICIQHRLLVWRDPLRSVQDKYPFVLQALAAVHGGKLDAIFDFSLLPAHLFHFFFIFLYVIKPFVVSLERPRALLQLIRRFQQIFLVHPAELGVLSQIIVIADYMADITDRRKRPHPAQHFQVITKFLDPVAHVTFILVIHQHMFPGDHLVVQAFPVQIPFGTVQHRQKIPAQVGSHSQPDIAEQIFGDPVFKQIRHLVPHPERHIVFHQFLNQKPGLRIGPIQNCAI